MGRAYEYFLQEQMRPYQKSNQYVCSKCVNDTFIKSYVRKNGKKGQCDFCGSQRNLISVNDLLGRLEYYLDCMYDVNDNPSPVDRGEYLYDDGVHFFDFVDEYMDCSAAFLAHLRELWDTSNFYYESDIKQLEYEGEELFVDWNNFVLKINDTVSCDKVLEYIKEHIIDAGGIRVIAPGDKIFRARSGLQNLTAKELGAPPDPVSRNNRFSEDGKSCFYGAFLQTTCLQEIGIEKGDAYSIGEWTPCKALTLIDFSNPDFYNEQIFERYHDSIWDKEKLSLFPVVSFLAHWIKDISVNVTDMTEERKKEIYRATQYVGEFFRKCKLEDGSVIDGIAYRSSKNTKHKNILIFCNSTECSEHNNRTDKSVLMMMKARTSEKRIWKNI